jgi:hypothetical protein
MRATTSRQVVKAKRRRDRVEQHNFNRRIDGGNGHDDKQQQQQRNDRGADDACANSRTALAGTHATASRRDVSPDAWAHACADACAHACADSTADAVADAVADTFAHSCAHSSDGLAVQLLRQLHPVC